MRRMRVSGIVVPLLLVALAVIAVPGASPARADTTLTPLLAVTATPQTPVSGDVVTVSVMSLILVQEATPGANNTTAYQNYTRFSPGPISLTVRGPNGSVLPESCVRCPLANGSYTVFVATNASLGYHTIYVIVSDDYTGRQAFTSFTVSMNPMDLIDANRAALASYEQNQSAAESARQSDRDTRQNWTLFGLVLLVAAAELRRSYRVSLLKNEPTWVDKVKATFGVRRNPFMKVQRANKPRYGGAKEGMRRKELQFNRRVLGKALADHLKLLEMGRTIVSHEAEMTKAIRSSRVAIGLPAEPGENVRGMRLAQIGSEEQVKGVEQ